MSWSLHCDRGAQIWKYDEQKKTNQHFHFNKKTKNSADQPYRAQVAQKYKPISIDSIPSSQLPQYTTPLATQVRDATIHAVNFYQTLQMDDGHWPGDYGGPLFLMPGMVITCYITGTELSAPHRTEMIKYLFHHQQSDGGWGLHIEGKSTMFGTVMNYVTLRLLGIEANDTRIQKTITLIKSRGGGMFVPSWGKFWLSVLGVLKWEGMNSIFPELWLLPELLPVHPSRWWCHCRMVYLPMAYIYGEKVTAKVTPLIEQLRNELFNEPWETIEWSKYRDAINQDELYTPQTKILKVLNVITNTYEKIYLPYFRKRATKFILDYIDAEDEQTNYIDIGPVNKFINMLAVWHGHGSNSEQFQLHQSRIYDYLWLAEDGMKVQGYNGSQLWDTAFCVQAIGESGIGHLFKQSLTKAYNYIEISQVLWDVKDSNKWYRHISNGGWPFSTRDHGWPISDCTAEGIKATLLLHERELKLYDGTHTITKQRLEDAVNVILSFQNTDGGWATYENTRSYSWLEYINPAEVFGGIMIDYSYTECSSASLQSLCAFRARYPTHRSKEINQSITRGIDYLLRQQRDDGSWLGSWAVCFTYGTWFGIEGLVAAGFKKHVAIEKACQFLVSKQNEDGGWGESYEACVTKQYVATESQVVNTSWALLSLLLADYNDQSVIERGIQFLLSRQLPNGDFPQERIHGVFNANCMISYTNYRNIFSIWALGRYMQKYKKL